MTGKPARGLFITGTDTGVGKTHVASAIARALVAEDVRVGVYKPAASGCQDLGDRLMSDDAEALWEAAGRPLTLDAVCPQRFRAPLAPHLAARAEGRKLDVTLLRRGLTAWEGACDIVLVEGAGGLLSPLGDEEYVADLAANLGYPLVVVAANVLGAINQTLQTLTTAAHHGLAVAGVVLNRPRPPAEGDISAASNRFELRRRSPRPILAELGYGQVAFQPQVDWQALAATSAMS